MRSVWKNEESIATLEDVLGRIRKKGVTLWQKDGHLHYKAPKGALTANELEGLRLHSRQIITLLERANDGVGFEPGALSRSKPVRAPLMYTQLAHWNHYKLSDRRGVRQVACAYRLRGRLNVAALEEGIAEVVRRHDALRIRVVLSGGIPVQEIAESINWRLEMDDVTGQNQGSRESRVRELIRQFIMEPIDVSQGPLFGIKLLKCGSSEHVLIVAMEHMISDEVSLRIFLQDVFAGYIQTLRGFPCCVPEIPTQLLEYALWQRNCHESWRATHGAYWKERLEKYARMKTPVEYETPSGSHFGWGAIRVWIGPELKAELREWCRLRQTTLTMGVLTAYAGLILRWYDSSEGVILFQTDGRDNSKLGRTIGFLSSALYLHVKLVKSDTFVDLIQQIREAYCQAYEHADAAYFASRVPRPGFTRNTLFNWIPTGTEIDLSPLDDSPDVLECASFPFTHPMLDKLESDLEPMILLFDSEEGVSGSFLFPRKHVSAVKIEQLGGSFLAFVEALLRQPDVRVSEMPLVR
jgi:Condensation domain/TubC N-terminal docking domain